MNDSDDLPLACPKGHAETRKSRRRVQENTFFICASCGAAVLIDKDAAMKLLAELRRDSE